jgi:N-ethylmaleimide reductase
MIIAEASQISPQGVGYMNTPGIHSGEQIQGWKRITRAVHEAGGRIFLQLWHVGRYSHSLLQPGGQLPVAPSAIGAEGQVNTPQGYKQRETPRALDISEIPGVIEQYRQGATNAMLAGFDGVEIHGANGYLLDQFLQDGTNKRNDEYGGSIANRARLMLEVTRAVINVWGSDKVGLRLSPSGTMHDMYDSDPVATFSYLAEQLNELKLCYLHLIEPLEPVDHLERYLKVVTPYYRKIYKGTLITNGGFDFETGNHIIEEGEADLVAFGKLFISNPDLVERFRSGAPLKPWDKETFYTSGEKGYIDY